MATQLNNKLIQLDNAVEKYYKQLNITNYRDHSGIGLFLNYIKTEQLDDPAIPIENELGDKCDPDNCAYTWMPLFPIPSYAQIPYNKQETFMFYILQYCYKHNQPPSNKYIQTTIIPKCTGTTNTTLPAKNVIINVNINKDYDSEIIGGYDYINNENKLQINLGNIMYGQNKDIIIQCKSKENNNNNNIEDEGKNDGN
eukprot:425311_1